MRKRIKAAMLLVAGALLVANALGGLAVAASDTVTVSFTVRPKIELALSANAVDFDQLDPGTHEFARKLTTTVKSNTIWSLTAQADGDFSDGGELSIPIGRLATRPGAGGWIAFATTSRELLTGQPRGGNNQNDWDYQLTIEWTDVPADYSATITYTATGS